jgi:Cysteine sulfinate desulfinase/cysteine desulfurase and related enzymes
MDLLAKPIYMDYSSTTPIDNRVLNAMIPYFTTYFGNPHSSHIYGVEALKAVKFAREKVAELIGASSEEVIFTSGATEANNIALRSCAEFLLGLDKNHLITTGIEHKSVLETMKYLSRNGFEITFIRVNRDGLLDLEELQKSIKSNTGLISVNTANNEIGVIQPIAQIAAICKERNILFHTDAVQAVGKIPINVKELGVDLLTLSGHKIYGPKGIGALYASKKLMYKLKPILFGGDQEYSIRPGTVPTPLCVGLGEACSISLSEMEMESERLLSLRSLFLDKLMSSCVGFKVNGTLSERIPGNLSICFDGVDAEALIIAVKNRLAISTGSACTSSSIEPSHVLLGIGLDEKDAESTVRITLGRFTTEDEVAEAVDILTAAVKKMRRLYR